MSDKKMHLPARVNNEIIKRLDEAANQGIVATTEIASQFERAFVIAQAVNSLRELLTDEVMQPIMKLQGNRLGFKTDKDMDRGYDLSVVRDCTIEAILNGVYVTGNEFNIIAGNCYITKEGFGHKLKNIHGLKYSIIPGIPHIKEGGAIVDMDINWDYEGKVYHETLKICVRVNKAMGVDAIIGKATRKARAWLWQQITGHEVSDGDVSEDSITIEANVISSSVDKGNIKESTKASEALREEFKSNKEENVNTDDDGLNVDF